jgi:predicted DNA-binding protein YlxM (UPF0122 family)
MLFAEHDLFQNFEGVNKSKDKNLMKDLIFSEIAKLIALHKKELLQNIKKINYSLPDTEDNTLIDFLFKRAASDKNVSDMLADMIKKYNLEETSGGDGSDTDWGGVASGLGDTIGGIFAFASTIKQSKTNLALAKEQTEQAKLLAAAQTEQAKLLAQVEAIKAANKKGLSKGALIGIIGGGIALISVILVLVFKKSKVQVVAAQ